MRITLFFLALFASFLTSAQTGTLSGKVTEKSSNLPISYATIVIKEADKVVTGGITDDNGLFDIKNLAPKNYVVEIQYMGYKTYVATADFTGGQRSIALGTIALQDEATKLNDVTVVAERSTIEQKIDRKVINVGRDLTTAGATASEILNNVPSVNVDQDGKLSLRGNENVRVLVDGRPTNIDVTQLLRQIPSTSIKRIELITNPSAKYNPEGMSGIINIVLHKNANDGFNASINSGLTIARTPKINNSVNMNYRTGKVNFFGTYGDNFGKQFNDGDIIRFDDDSRQIFDIVNDNKSHLFKIGMDFYIDDKNTISVYTNQNYMSGDGVVNLDISSATLSANLFQQSKYFTDFQDGAYNIAYKRLFATEGETLDVEINHDYFRETQRGEFTTDFDDPMLVDNFYLDFNSERRRLTTANVDYVKPLNENTTLELGAEARITRTLNEYITGQDDFSEPGQEPAASDSDYTYDLDIYSAYATFGQKIGKYGYQLGLRLESYKVNAEEYGLPMYEDDYLTVYPSASMTYTPSEKNMFQLSYSRRVDRPSLDQTKPIREFSTPRVTSLGNPELDPQFTNSVELNYTRTLEKGSISGGIYGRLIDDEISRILYPDPNNEEMQIMTFRNFDNNFAFGFELSANYKITKWWDIQPAVDFSSIRQKGAVSIINPDTDEFEFTNREVTASALNARMNSNFRATKSLRFLIFGFYRSGVRGLQFKSQDMYKIDAGGRYSFLKDKAVLSVRVNDIFNWQYFGFDGDAPYPQTGQFGWESRSVYIGFNYSFGAGKNRTLQRKQRDNNTQQGGGGFF